MPKWRRINVDTTTSRRIDVYTTSFLRHVLAELESSHNYTQPKFAKYIVHILKL